MKPLPRISHKSLINKVIEFKSNEIITKHFHFVKEPNSREIDGYRLKRVDCTRLSPDGCIHCKKINELYSQGKKEEAFQLCRYTKHEVEIKIKTEFPNQQQLHILEYPKGVHKIISKAIMENKCNKFKNGLIGQKFVICETGKHTYLTDYSQSYFLNKNGTKFKYT